MMFGKPPELLSRDEAVKFDKYKQWKIGNGMPIENYPIYKPQTSDKFLYVSQDSPT